MKKKYTVYFTDGSSNIIEIEKPAGAHPDSPCALKEVLTCAEHTGKTVTRAGRPIFFKGKIIEKYFMTREDIIKKSTE